MCHVLDRIQHPSPSNFLFSRGGGGGVDNIFVEQLRVEVEVQRLFQELLDSYTETQNWQSVSEVAQALATNSDRIVKLKKQIESKTSQILPYLEASLEPCLSSFPGGASEEKSVCGIEVCDEAGKLKEDESIQLVLPTISASHITEYKVTRETKGVSNTEEKNPLLEQAHKDHSSYLVEVQKGDSMEESMADHFEDLNKCCAQKENSYEKSSLSVGAEQNKTSGEIQATKACGGDSINLEVPVDNIDNYASSESSGQFFSPRVSLYIDDDGESEEESEFVDARSEKDKSPDAWEDHQSAQRNEVSPNIVTVSKSGVVNDHGVYCITLERDTSLRLAKTVLDPVIRSHAEIVQLRDQLSSTFNESLETQFPFHSDLENANEDKDISGDLERFFNQIASFPDKRETAIFMNFLNSDCQDARGDVRGAPDPLNQGTKLPNI